MSQSRIDVFKQMAEQQPDDVMVWYGLGSEYFKLEQWAEAATALQRVITLNKDYTAAYQLLGSALLNQGEREEARRVWTEGIATASRTGAWKAGQHMERLLAENVSDDASGFCE